jgi:flagellar assembly protein FliH
MEAGGITTAENETKVDILVREQEIENPYEIGYSEGQYVAETRFTHERAALTELLISANAMQPEASEELALLIGETVFSLVSSIVGAVNIDRNWLAEQAKAAVDIIRECDDARTIRLHPEDAALLADTDLPLAVIVDEDAKRGSIHIDCSNGWVESGVSIYLETLRAELGLNEVVK